MKSIENPSGLKLSRLIWLNEFDECNKLLTSSKLNLVLKVCSQNVHLVAFSHCLCHNCRNITLWHYILCSGDLPWFANNACCLPFLVLPPFLSHITSTCVNEAYLALITCQCAASFNNGGRLSVLALDGRPDAQRLAVAADSVVAISAHILSTLYSSRSSQLTALFHFCFSSCKKRCEFISVLWAELGELGA